MNKSLSQIISLTFALMVLVAEPCAAALSVSATSLEGGSSLRFGRINQTIDSSKEVRVRINTNDAKQYQVFQRISEDFVNEKGQSLGANAFMAHTRSGTNSFGSLYAQTVERVGLSDQLVYTSSANGDSDSFSINYLVDVNRIKATGKFFGKIKYTVRPISGGQQQDVYLNVFLDAEGQFQVEVSGALSHDQIRLEAVEGRDSDQLNITFKEFIGAKISIYQEVRNFPHNELFEELNDGVIKFMASGNLKGELYPLSYMNLDRKRTLIYESDAMEESFVLSYVLDLDKSQIAKAGQYDGEVVIMVDVNNQLKEYPIRLSAKVNPIFKMDISFPDSGVAFSKVLPNSPPQIKEVVIDVRSNLGKPYMVSQSVSSGLTNKSGDIILKQYFQLKGELKKDSKGKMASADFVPVNDSQMPIFYSDRNGQSSRFSIFYRLRSYPDIKPGDYSTSMVYSLGEM